MTSITAVLLLFASPLFANEGLHFGIHHLNESPRALGMGGAFTAGVNDYNALYFNPAALARLEAFELNMNIDLGGSASIAKFMDDIKTANQTTGTESQKTQAMLELLQKQYGRQYSARAGLGGHIVWPHWGIGVVPADLSLDMKVHNQGTPALNARAYLDSYVVLGFGRDYKGIPGRLSWGVTTKFVNRGYLNTAFTALDLVADSQVVKTSDLREGYGFDGDLGFLYTPQLPGEGLWSYFRSARPTFALVVRNLAETKFSSNLKLINKSPSTTDSNNPPEKLYRVFDIGTKWEYPSAWIFGGRGLMDFRDIGHPNASLRKSFHLGFEFDWRMYSWWKGQYRIGVNQGYPTFGLSALFAVFNLDFVTYGEDVGTYDAPKENRMYMVRLNINI